MNINPHLIWDYHFSEREQESESFKRWYVGRVLQRGGVEDIRSVGLETIHKYLPELSLPNLIKDYWQWFFESKAH